jgi:hypothetical protein
MARASRIAHATWSMVAGLGSNAVLLADRLEVTGGDEIVDGVSATVGGLPATV